MKNLSLEQMEVVEGGLSRDQIIDIECLALGTLYGLAHPIADW